MILYYVIDTMRAKWIECTTEYGFDMGFYILGGMVIIVLIEYVSFIKSDV